MPAFFYFPALYAPLTSVAFYSVYRLCRQVKPTQEDDPTPGWRQIRTARNRRLLAFIFFSGVVMSWVQWIFSMVSFKLHSRTWLLMHDMSFAWTLWLLQMSHTAAGWLWLSDIQLIRDKRTLLFLCAASGLWMVGFTIISSVKGERWIPPAIPTTIMEAVTTANTSIGVCKCFTRSNGSDVLSVQITTRQRKRAQCIIIIYFVPRVFIIVPLLLLCSLHLSNLQSTNIELTTTTCGIAFPSLAVLSSLYKPRKEQIVSESQNELPEQAAAEELGFEGTSESLPTNTTKSLHSMEGAKEQSMHEAV